MDNNNVAVGFDNGELVLAAVGTAATAVRVVTTIVGVKVEVAGPREGTVD